MVGVPGGICEYLFDEVIDELLAGARREEEIVGRPGGVHLVCEPHQEPPGGSGNTRNGATAKTLATEQGPTPRDRKGTFEPQIVRKG